MHYETEDTGAQHTAYLKQVSKLGHRYSSKTRTGIKQDSLHTGED